MLYFIIILVIVLAALGILIIHFYNQFQLTFIKIDEAENNIELLLDKKLALFTRIVSVLEKTAKKSDFAFFDINQLKSKKLNHFEMRDALSQKHRELNEILDQDPKLNDNESLQKLLDDLTDIETDLDAAIRYYNDNVVLYNKLIRCFPSNLLGIILRYKRKEFYQEEKEEIFEILKK